MSETAQIKRRASPKKDHLLDTAYRLFYAEGYHAVGIDKILAEAKTAKMTLYHHFKSKDELIVAALERRGLEIGKSKMQVLAKAKQTPIGQIEGVFDWLEQWFETSDFNGCAMLRAIAEYPNEDSIINQAVKRIKQKSVDFIQSQCELLELKKPKELAYQIFLLTEGAIIQAHTFNNPQAAKNGKAAALTLIRSALEER